MKYAAYKNYKFSGTEWIGDIPSEWECRRLKDCGALLAGAGFPHEFQGLEDEELPFYKVGDLSQSLDGRHMASGEHTISRATAYTLRAKVIPPSAVVYAKIGAALLLNRRRITVKYCCIDNNMTAFIPNQRKLSTAWAHYWLCTLDFGEFTNPGAIPSLSEGYQATLPITLPPLDEQQTIARFLDAKTAQIDALVAQKQQLITKLKEKRSALIARTVTHGLPPDAAKAVGLEPNPEMKDSGVDWLGPIPGHWNIEKFSREVHIAEGQVAPEVEPFVSMILIAPNHIESGTGHLLALETAAEQFAESGKYLCPANAVVYSKIRPALRKVVIAPKQCLCSADMYPLTCKRKLLNPYLYWLLLSDQFSAWSVLEADRVAMPKINRETLNELRLPIPPQHEQLKIVEYLVTETAKVDNLLAKADTVINRLTEYRQALITSAVTGKIDVRELV